MLGNENGPVKMPINGNLDLHSFRPSEVASLIPEYLNSCRKEGIYQVRIIHGKGTGALKETVNLILKKIPEVIRFKPAGYGMGGWGATIVYLKSK